MAKVNVNVGSYYRDGKQVRGYTQQRDAWKHTAMTGSLALASLVGTIFQIAIFSFTLFSTVLMALTAVLTAVTGLRMRRILRPRRRGATAKRRPSSTRSKTRRPRPKAAKPRPRPGSRAGPMQAMLAAKEKRRQARRAWLRARAAEVKGGARRATSATGRGIRHGARWAMAKARTYGEKWRKS